MTVRVRYAPSPTGNQHIGGVRTALFNFLFAHSQGGAFVLRVEDTDRSRYKEDALENTYSTLSWLGLLPDESPRLGGAFGPYLQSERLPLYHRYAEELLEKGALYPCFCSSKKSHSSSREEKNTAGYDRRCRQLDLDVARKRRKTEPYALRFKGPLEGKVVFHDILLGRISRRCRDISPDPVLIKEDGYPTYHFANVIDDHAMMISHVLRSQEWVPSTPLHILLYAALGWTPPSYCHLPMVIGKDGSKLSKRHGAFSVEEFRHAGYLPEALINYIALLGWAYDDSREFFSKTELISLFSLEKLKKSPATFDPKKLKWFNGHYIRQMPPEELKPLLLSHLAETRTIATPPTPEEEQILEEGYPLVRERLTELREVPSLMAFLYQETISHEAALASLNTLEREDALYAVSLALRKIDHLFSSSDQDNERDFREVATQRECSLGKLLQPLRIALTGSRVSLPLFPSIRLLGKERTMARFHSFLDALSSLLADSSPSAQKEVHHG